MAKGLKVFFKVFIITLLIGCFVIAGILIAGFMGAFTSDSDFDISSLELKLTSTIYYYDENGVPQELEQLYGVQNCIWADISTMPDDLKNAIVAIEDERFYKHNGVDFPRTTKAFFTYITKGGSSSFGGSTITQQLVKNITDDREDSPERKIREMWSAMEVERRYSKEQILELYLNTIYLSNGCSGVQAAASKYFGKDVSELSLAECASIAGITQYPTLYDPLINPEKNIEKQHTVLMKMLQLGYITQAEHDAAVAEELYFQNRDINSNSSVHSYFVDMIINDVIHDLQVEKGYSAAYAEKLVYNGGLKIYATIDPSIQREMETVYNDPENFPSVSGSPTPQSAMVIIDVHTGAIKGTVGGIGEKTGYRLLNRSTQSIRQPGSTIKPLGVYAPAIELGILSPGSLILDAPIDIGGWKPSNYYSGYNGEVTARNAVEQSMNTPAVRVLQEVGVEYSFSFVTHNLGIPLVEYAVRNGKGYSDKSLASLALGGLTDGVSALNLAAAYAPFANNGMYNKPYSYTKIVDNNGKTVLENSSYSSVAMSEQTAYLTHTMLKSVVDNGTGQAAQLPCGMPAAGKTGTTDEQNDRWFVGYTPDYVGVVWYGYDIPESLEFLTSHPCIPVWRKIMNAISKDKPIRDFGTQPSGISRTVICLESGQLATAFCEAASASTSNEYFLSSIMPIKLCEKHTQESLEPEEPEPEPESEEPPEVTDDPGASPAPDASPHPSDPNLSVSPSVAPTPLVSPTPSVSAPIETVTPTATPAYPSGI